MSSKNKKNPRIFYYCCKDYPKLSASYLWALHPKLSRIYNNGMKIHKGFFGFTAMQSFSSYLCHSSAYSKKKNNVGTERSPHQPNDNNITQNKGSNFIHHSIIYCEERDKIQKNPSSTSDDLSETIATELFINKSHVILHALQKLQYIYKFQWDFPLSLSFFLSLLYSS